MKLSLTAVTANRAFTKALIRNSDALAALRGSLTSVVLPSGRIETLQIVFQDENPGAVKAPEKVENLTQVEVGIPEDLGGHPIEPAKLVAFVKEAVLRAISDLLIPTNEREMLLARVRAS